MEETPKESGELLESVVKLVNSIIESGQAPEIAKTFSEGKTARAKLTLENAIGLRKFMTRRIWVQLVVIICVTATVAFLGYTGKIDGSTTGTLMGSIIGYTVGKFAGSGNN